MSEVPLYPHSGPEVGLLVDCCITQLKAEGPSRTCNESKEEEKEPTGGGSYKQGAPVPALRTWGWGAGSRARRGACP